MKLEFFKWKVFTLVLVFLFVYFRLSNQLGMEQFGAFLDEMIRFFINLFIIYILIVISCLLYKVLQNMRENDGQFIIRLRIDDDDDEDWTYIPSSPDKDDDD